MIVCLVSVNYLSLSFSLSITSVLSHRHHCSVSPNAATTNPATTTIPAAATVFSGLHTHCLWVSSAAANPARQHRCLLCSGSSAYSECTAATAAVLGPSQWYSGYLPNQSSLTGVTVFILCIPAICPCTKCTNTQPYTTSSVLHAIPSRSRIPSTVSHN